MEKGALEEIRAASAYRALRATVKNAAAVLCSAALLAGGASAVLGLLEGETWRIVAGAAGLVLAVAGWVAAELIFAFLDLVDLRVRGQG